MLAGNENFVKPDRMITRYLENITGTSLSEKEKIQIVRDASAILSSDFKLTPRGLDHEIWKFQKDNGVEGINKSADVNNDMKKVTDKNLLIT